MDKSRIEQLIIELSEQEAAGISGGASLNEKTVKVRDWDASVIEGCCTQSCCNGAEQMQN